MIKYQRFKSINSSITQHHGYFLNACINYPYIKNIK